MQAYRGVIMGDNKGARKANERFFDAYSEFDGLIRERYNIEEDGVHYYLVKMKEAVLEAREAIPEWDTVYKRLKAIRDRYRNLKEGGMFDDFQGKDEDLVWMQVFTEKLEADADPLSKYSRLGTLHYKNGMTFWQKVITFFGG